MNIEQLDAGKNPPEDINVVIEIPAHHLPVKYEVDKASGAVFVDRFLATPMFYPANYGYIPHSLADDGDPMDALVITPYPLAVASVIRCRPVGVLEMTDESGEDAKIIAVPHDKLTNLYQDIDDIQHLPDLLQRQIAHFFENYKDLEEGKWVKIKGWADKAVAKQLIAASLKTA